MQKYYLDEVTIKEDSGTYSIVTTYSTIDAQNSGRTFATFSSIEEALIRTLIIFTKERTKIQGETEDDKNRDS